MTTTTDVIARRSLRAVLFAVGAVGVTLGATTVHAQTAPAEPAAADPGTAPPPSDVPPKLVESDALTEKQVEAVRKEVQTATKQFEYHGYVRAGFGVNGKGGDQDAFQAPGAPAKYRLGNETETYGEGEWVANWLNPDRTDTWFKTSIKLAFVSPRNGTFDVLDAIAVREVYAEAGKVLASKPDMTFWAGTRFYRRRDVHINDYFFQDMSGYGGGFQNLKLGEKAQLHVAYLGGSVQDNDNIPTNPLPDVGRFAKNTLDIRVSDIPAGPGSLEIWLIPTLAADDGLGGNHNGFGGGVFYFTPMMGGFNEAAVEFGYGGAANLSTSIGQGLADDGTLFRFVDRLTVQPSPTFGMQATGIVQLDNSDGVDSGNLWVSFGARPVFALSKYTALAIEGGVDIVKPGEDDAETGFVGKVTVAPMIRPAMDFWARPEIRAFVTAAFWNDAVQGGVGGPAYADDTFGITAGLHMESWW